MIQPKCNKCRKARGHHQAKTLYCPIGQKRSGTFWQFHRTETFTLKPFKPRARIATRSSVKTDLHSDYIRAKAIRITEHPTCECCAAFKLSPVQPAQDGHHPFGQAGKLIKVFVVVCRDCHTRIHTQPGEARSSGWLCDSTKIRNKIAAPVRAAIMRAGMPELLNKKSLGDLV